MRRNIPAIFVLLLPAAAVAQTVAVPKVSYKIYRTAAQSPERADKVLEAVHEAVEKVGMTPVAADAAGPCSDNECLSEAAKRAGADFYVQVGVVDNDGQFDLSVMVNGAEPATMNPFGTFNSMLKRISAMVEASLNEAKDKKPVEVKAPEPEPEPEPEPVTKPDPGPTTPPPTEPEPPKKEPRKKPIKKPVFFAMVGVTAGLGGALAAVEGVNYSKWDKAGRPGDLTSQMNHLQIASIALIGCTAVAGVATIVLGVLTNFEKDKGDNVSLAPMFSEGAQGTKVSGLMIKGEF